MGVAGEVSGFGASFLRVPSKQEMQVCRRNQLISRIVLGLEVDERGGGTGGTCDRKKTGEGIPAPPLSTKIEAANEKQLLRDKDLGKMKGTFVHGRRYRAAVNLLGAGNYLIVASSRS